MKNIVKIASIIISIFLMPSCMDKIDIEVKNKESLITIDAIITDLRQDQVIKITRTDNYFSGLVPPAVTGAQVWVRDMNSDIKYYFIDQGDGSYVFNLQIQDTLVRSGHHYELNVVIGAFAYKSVVASNRSAKIDALYVDSTLVEGKVSRNLKLMARDSKGPIADFYWIKSYLNGKFLNRVDQIRIEEFGFNNELDGGYFNPMILNSLGEVTNENQLKSGDTVRVEILGIGRETYEFLNLGKQMSNNGGLFAATSVNLPCNIAPVEANTPRPTGIFNISEVSSMEILIK